MPLIVISGFPCSGKSTRTKQLEEYFKNKGKNVEIVSENVSIHKAELEKNECYSNFQKEKIIRSDMKSEVIRLLNKDSVVILDGLNYIKGYRYELFCATKAARTTQCTIFCAIQNDKAWEFNNNHQNCVDNDKDDKSKLSTPSYTKEIFDSLCLRYEEPSGNCRWDKPLFVVFPEDELDFEAIYDTLFHQKTLIPNQSTQNPPLSATNYLFELDRITKEIINDIIEAKKIGITGPIIHKSNCAGGGEAKIDICVISLNVIQLNKLRRQFINYSKMHTNGSSLEKIHQLFIQFLNSNCK